MTTARSMMQVGRCSSLVTGGASGLGEAVARMLTAAGGPTTIADLDRSRGDEVAASLGPSARFVAADVTSEVEVEAAVATAVAHGARLDVCVNCAGVNPGQMVLDRDGEPHSLDSFRRAIEVNLVGLFDVVRRAAAAMARNEPGADGERGVIVNLSSISAFEGQPAQAGYAASKAGVNALTLQLARELAPRGIRVVAIAPGLMETPMVGAIPDRWRESLERTAVFPSRLGIPAELAALVRTVIETPLLNGEVIRLDAAARLP